MRILLSTLFILLSFIVSSQEYSYKNIPKQLLENANSVVRLDDKNVIIEDQKTIITTEKRIVTVLNRKGNSSVDAFRYYDPVTRIKDIRATVYNSAGSEIAAYKKRDFKDVSAVSGGSLYSDSRMLYLDYTPTTYPYTVIFQSEVQSKNTADIPSFYALSNYLSSAELVKMTVTYPEELGFKFKQYNIQENVEIIQESSTLSLRASDIPALKGEPYSPSFSHIVPHVDFAINKFHLEGVDGNATDWKSFGRWMTTNLIEGTTEIPEETAQKIKMLTQDVDDVVERAKIVYNFVQQSTRYISVQVGIGGWKPIKASDVDRLGYGDCKGLSNYTKALLEIASVPSYYTVLYGSSDMRDIDAEFASIQGNHVILTVPVEDDYIWLECTSQDIPFGFIGGFTDDRDVLILEPEGGKIVHTKKYTPQENLQYSEGTVAIRADGGIKTSIDIVSEGTQYEDTYRLEKETEDDKKSHYYSHWDYINNLEILDIKYANDKENAQFTEKIIFEADNYASFAGDEMLVKVNVVNRFNHTPPRLSDRKLPIELDRGFYDEQSTILEIPEGFKVSYIPDAVELESPFGRYEMSLERRSDNQLMYKRSFTLYDGEFDKSQYDEFRSFLKQVGRLDATKMILTKEI